VPNIAFTEKLEIIEKITDEQSPIEIQTMAVRLISSTNETPA